MPLYDVYRGNWRIRGAPLLGQFYAFPWFDDDIRIIDRLVAMGALDRNDAGNPGYSLDDDSDDSIYVIRNESNEIVVTLMTRIGHWRDASPIKNPVLLLERVDIPNNHFKKLVRGRQRGRLVDGNGNEFFADEATGDDRELDFALMSDREDPERLISVVAPSLHPDGLEGPQADEFWLTAKDIEKGYVGYDPIFGVQLALHPTLEEVQIITKLWTRFGLKLTDPEAQLPTALVPLAAGNDEGAFDVLRDRLFEEGLLKQET